MNLWGLNNINKAVVTIVLMGILKTELSSIQLALGKSTLYHHHIRRWVYHLSHCTVSYNTEVIELAYSHFKLPYILSPLKLRHVIVCSLFQRVVLHLQVRVEGL